MAQSLSQSKSQSKSQFQVLLNSVQEDDKYFVILDKYSLYRDYIFRKPQFTNIIIALLYLQKQSGKDVDTNEPFYEDMKNFDSSIFEGTDYQNDIEALFNITKHIGILIVSTFTEIEDEDKLKIYTAIRNYTI